MEKESRLVHLDLKGAPPKLSYYHQIFPLMRDWGATGLLVEYEDMFPYSNHLKDLTTASAYSPEDVASLQQLAKQYGFDFIPLVQSFGHFEFVLKHDKFRYIREVEKYPMALCPSHPDSMDLVIAMFEQVLALHPDVKWFHIGADEVYHLAVCETCQLKMVENNWNKVDLFLDYIARLLRRSKQKFPGITFIMWDDMLRNVSDVSALTKYGIGSLVELMVWHYMDQFDLDPKLFERYSKVFPNIWVASAYKGATGPCAIVTDINYHLNNHKIWHALMVEERHRFKCFRGYAVTGWQRYDHYSVMCELLPVGLPCLAVCLSFLTKGIFTIEMHKRISQQLGFQEVFPLAPFLCLDNIPSCNFPGSSIYCEVLQLLKADADFQQFIRNDRILGWMTDYHLRHNFTNPLHIEHIIMYAERMLSNFQLLFDTMKLSMSAIFFEDTVDEWLTVNIQLKIHKLTEIIENANAQIKLGGRAKHINVSMESCATTNVCQEMDLDNGSSNKVGNTTE